MCERLALLRQNVCLTKAVLALAVTCVPQCEDVGAAGYTSVRLAVGTLSWEAADCEVEIKRPDSQR